MTKTMELKKLLSEVQDGDLHGWEVEFAYLRTHHADKMRTLIESILLEGVREPVLIGPDNRVWDGHHRIYAAWLCCLKEIPVERVG